MSLKLSKNDIAMVAVLLSGAFLTYLNLTLMTPALPTIMATMSVDQATVQWLTSAYCMTEAIVVPLAAYLMGRFTTRQLFLFGMVLFAAGSMTAAVAPVFAVILLGRIMQAAATGYMMTMVFSVILLVFPKESRGMAMGLVGLIIGVAPAIGPVLSGILVDHVGWRIIFVLASRRNHRPCVLRAAQLRQNPPFEIRCAIGRPVNHRSVQPSVRHLDVQLHPESPVHCCNGRRWHYRYGRVLQASAIA